MNEILKKRIEEAADTEMSQYYNDDEYPCGIKDIQSDFKEAFKIGAEYALSHQFISVEEAMPELNEEVLVLFPDGSATVALRHKTFNAFGGDAIVWRNGDYTYDDSWIKFWMPIPKLEPYKTE